MRLQLLVGPVASGKSTFCRIAAKEGAVIMNDDAIVMAVHGGDYKLYSTSLKPLYKTVENSIVQGALLLNRRVIIDRPNYSKAMRRRYIGLAKSLDVPVDVIMMDVYPPEVHARRRADSDGRGHSYEYWLKVVNYHNSLYEEPSLDEGIDSIVRWNFPTGA